MKLIPPFFLPSEIVMIDDDEMLLEGWSAKLGASPINLKTFHNPFEGLQHIQSASITSVQNSYDSFYQQIFDGNRFKQVSTVIVDFDMPGLNGLEVCRKISSPFIQKIMLTGAASNAMAIEAFNEGIIHQFLQKSDPELFEKLPTIITKAQEKYFELALHDLTNQAYLESSESDVLRDPVFVEFFNALIHEKKIVEHYLLDVTGSFLFLNDKGETSALFVFNEEMLETQEDMIPEQDRDSVLAKNVYERTHAVCFYLFKNHPSYHEDLWKDYLQPLSILEGNHRYFYAFQPKLPYLNAERIFSFKRYLEG